MTRSCRLRQAAKDDLVNIGHYTEENHGVRQRNAYLHGLNGTFASLSEMPFKGRQRDEVKDGYYSYDYRKHVIFYRIHPQYIEIIGIIHNRMLPENHL